MATLMVLAALLVVFVTTQHSPESSLQPLESAAQEILGQAAAVRVEATPVELSDAEALERAGSADGVVELSWGEDHRTADLHCYIAREQRWVDRRITFAPDDEEPERSRLLGFAVASMLTNAPHTSSVENPDEQPAERPAREPESSPDTGVRRTQPREEVRRHAVEVAAVASMGIEGESDAIGAAAGLRFLSSPVGLRLSLGGRAGEIPSAQATTRTALGGVGLLVPLTRPQSQIELGVRIETLASWFEVARLSRDAQVERESRWLFGGAATAEGGFWIARAAALYAGLGLEGMLGKTAIYTDGQRAATVPALRGVGEIGFRSRF